jgi:parallel beta-helix repeat protein
MEGFPVVRSERRLRVVRLAMTVGLAAFCLAVLLWLLGGANVQVTAALVPSELALSAVEGVEGPTSRSLQASGDVITVCLGGGCDHASIQAAVDAASPGDVVKVAQGTYTDIHARVGITQVVYVNKTVTIRGGYTTTNGFADPPDPVASPTTLDAQGRGRVLYITGYSSPTIEGLRLTGGNAAGLGGDPRGGDAGGGLYLYYSDATLSGNTVLANTAERNGGGLFLYHSTATLSSNTISGNSANQASGGGLYLYHSAATLISNTISHNSADKHSGGGLALLHSDAALISNTVSNNSAHDGGGLYLGYGDDTTLTSNTVSNNSALSGGGLYLYYSDATLGDNTVSANTAYGNGGGLYLYYSYACLNDNAVFSNTATWDGGGLYLNASYSTLTDNVVSDNLAKLDGGGLVLSDSDGATLSDNTVTTNTATDRGGGLYLYESDATLSGNTVFGNSSTETWGGGLLLDRSDATLNGNTISANSARTGGGGLVLWYSNTMLTNNVVADNQAGAAGSGLYISGSSPRLLHTTVARNHGGDGSGVHVTNAGSSYSTVWLSNTILVSHMVGVTVTAGNTATLEATLWGTDTWANPADWGGAGIIVTGTINLWGGPAFWDADAGNYHILFGSAAIDAGVDAGVTTDIDGNPRPLGLAPDIGADELWAVYLPLVMTSTTTIAGEYALVGNPCTTDPCLPCVVYAVIADDTTYHLTVEGHWLCENRSWDGYTPESGDWVTVTGYVSERVDIRGDPFYDIEVSSLKPAGAAR